MNHQRRQALPGAIVQFARNPAAFLVLQLQQTPGEIAKRFFGILARCDVPVYFENADRPTLLIVLQHLAARYMDSPSVLREVHQFAFPGASAQ